MRRVILANSFVKLRKAPFGAVVLTHKIKAFKCRQALQPHYFCSYTASFVIETIFDDPCILLSTVLATNKRLRLRP